ncbi:dTMP kinase [Candidatus Saccharibacteria bacterium]|nr:dTMP kinase [Candidatus Saccharibacteria bacterium]
MHIVIEGQDATGKDTQAQLLADYLRAQGKTVVHYAESGTNSEDFFIAEIAKLNYGSRQNIDNRTRVLLYLVNRYEQWRRLAEPALKNGDYVITTRNWLSTLIYEGYVGKVSKSTIIKVHKTILPERYFRPDKIAILTLSDKDRAARLSAQGREKSEFWKSKPSDTQSKINASYLRVAREYNVPTLDASGTIDEVQSALRKLFNL